KSHRPTLQLQHQYPYPTSLRVAPAVEHTHTAVAKTTSARCTSRAEDRYIITLTHVIMRAQRHLQSLNPHGHADGSSTSKLPNQSRRPRLQLNVTSRR